jgi:hypothetical protein
MDIPGRDCNVCHISSRIWFFKYLGWLKVFLSKTKKYERDANEKYSTAPNTLLIN